MCEMFLAQVLAMTGDRDGAFDKLSKLVNQPFSLINYGDLKLNSMWDDLRDDPRDLVVQISDGGSGTPSCASRRRDA